MSAALLADFLAEAGELVQQATEDLLALERDPGDAGCVERVFRAFHTLKGSAALFEFGPLTATLHAAEDLLSALREGRVAAGTRAVADPVLDCLEQVTRWLAAIEAQGGMPPEAAAEAAGLIARLRRAAGGSEGEATPAVTAAGDFDWVTALTGRDRAAIRDRVRDPSALLLAIEYDPDPGCFFHGDDPLGLIRRVPDLALCRIAAREPWPALAEMDAFRCNLRIRALAVTTPAQAAEARTIFRLLGPQARIAELPVTRVLPMEAFPARPAAPGTALVRAVLEEQRRMLTMSAEGPPDGQAGRAAAAARTAANALRSAGDEEGAARIEAACAAGPARPDAGRVDPERVDPERVDPERVDPERVDRAIAEALRPPAPGGVPAAAERAGARLLRVDPARVDRLVALADEMVLARNALQHLLRRAERELGAGRDLVRGLKDQHAILDRLTREWHEAAMGLRMVPLAEVFRRLPRLVRTLAQQLGRNVELVVEGEGTEADKDVVDGLFEPLVHLVRNSLDHGIETPEERRRAGKPETARLTLRACQEADRVVVEVIDDGRGVDAEALRRTAIARGVMEAERAAALTEAEAVDLVFASGLSTAGAVSEISGRGVGMDAVRAAVERAGGTATIRSRPGEGTAVRLVLPFSVTLAQILTVEVDGQVFGLPLERVVESVRVPRARIRRPRDGAAAFAFGDRVVPLVCLRQALGLPGPDRGVAGGEARIVVVEAGGQQAGLEVDDLGDRLEVVLRPLGGLLAGMRGYLGTTLLGSGRVLMVLDVGEVLR